MLRRFLPLTAALCAALTAPESAPLSTLTRVVWADAAVNDNAANNDSAVN